MALDKSPYELAKNLEEDGLELTLSRLAEGTYGSPSDECYQAVKTWCDTQSSLSGERDSKESISLSRDAIAAAKHSNRIALEANDFAEAANKRASRADSIARAAIYIALATLTIQAWPYIKSII